MRIIKYFINNFIRHSKKFLEGLPRIYWGKYPATEHHSGIVIFPYNLNLLRCGLVGLVEFKKRDRGICLDIVKQIHDLFFVLKEKEEDEHQYSSQWIRERSEVIKELEQITGDLKQRAVFYDIFIDKQKQQTLSEQSQDLLNLIEVEEKRMEKQGVHIPSSLLEVLNKELITLKDVVWRIQNECLKNIQKVENLISLKKSSSLSTQLVKEFQKINIILNNLDRLEVRGRDSAGVSIMVSFPDSESFENFFQQVKEEGYRAEFEERQQIENLLNKTIFYHIRTITFTYKVSAEIGKLGDNIAALRQIIRQDHILPIALQGSRIYSSMIAHTRWASVGMISEENCHPVNNEYRIADKLFPQNSYAVKNSTSQEEVVSNCFAPHYHSSIGIIQVALNGDIDNYSELKATWEKENGGSINEQITTDTKIIPLQVEFYLRQGFDVSESFRKAVNDFEGSQAIALHSNLEPDRVFLALRGSGQTIFIGIGSEGYLLASEIYGFVEQTSRFVKMNGEKERVPGDTKTQGQIFILDGNSSGETAGIIAMSYDGHPLNLSSKDIQSTEITTRDIDRRGYPHFFLKEILESSLSVKKTIFGKVDLINAKNSKPQKVVFNMGTEIIPRQLEQALIKRKIKNIYMVGQGTAGIAAEGIAMLFKEYLKNSGIQIAEQKASELSGFSLDVNRDDTLVIAVTQSGTTTDTNKAVDMARSAGAYTIAIVNRRDSDITYKVHGVFYTSDGRDIEMSVASTKAFYSQIVAGCLLALRFTQIMGLCSEEYLMQEIKQLKRLPRLMEQTLKKNKEKIAASAQKWAFSKLHWAVVGSGPNKVAADEIRIKLSELCYKTLPSDVVEDRKHIDLSAEPLIIVCAAGSREIVLGDIIKDVAIFKAHKATTIVFADVGEERFNFCADSLIHVPKVNEHFAPILNTIVGHLWGYYAALRTDEEANFLKSTRQLLNKKINKLNSKGYNSLEIIFNVDFQNLVNEFSFIVHQKNRQGVFNAAVKPNTLSDLTLLLKYAGGKLPITDLEKDFKVDRGVSNCLFLLSKTLDQTINELSRPIDAIKHQAKTVTVGTSRLPELFDGQIFDRIKEINISIDSIAPFNLSTIKRFQPIIRDVTGYTLYEIEHLDHLGRPTEGSTIKILAKEGVSKNLGSRVEKDPRLRGRKRSIITNNTVFIGLGKSDNAKLLIIPAQGKEVHQKKLVLLHIAFEDNIPLPSKINALGSKYEDLVDALVELDISWQDDFLNDFSTSDLFSLSEDYLIEAIQSRLNFS